MFSVLQRRLPVGAEPAGGGVHFRVWAPRRKQIEVVLDQSSAVSLDREPNGYFSGIADSARAGMHYRFRLDGGLLVPDPASRFQPEGPHGPSEVVNPSSYRWKDDGWRGVHIQGQVI